MDNYSLAECFAKAYNNMNASYLEPALDEKFEYSSTWIYETMKGKDRFLSYFSDKLDLIRERGGELKAEIFIWTLIDAAEHKNKNPNIFLYQKIVDQKPYDSTIVSLISDGGDINEYMVVAVLLEFANEKITSGYIFPVAMLGSFKKTGDFPN